ncbi:MAG TPA: ABC transporter permease, partial [Rhodocyclaceae bacterium]|nr:ABC transporter permease [Rhodocyclaceae bacterium]
SISVINGEDLYKLAGDGGARGVGITQVVPSPFSGSLKVVREYQQALKKFAPNAKPSYASLEEYIGGRVLIESLKHATEDMTKASVMTGLESMNTNIGGFKIRFGPNLRTGSSFVEVSLIGQDGTSLQ